MDLTLYTDGSCDLSSTGRDGSRSSVTTTAATVWASVIDSSGRRTVSSTSADGKVTKVRARRGAVLDGYLEYAYAKDDVEILPGGHESPAIRWIDRYGAEITGTHTGNAKGDWWESGHKTQGVDPKDGSVIPAVDYVRIHRAGPGGGETVELGTNHEPGKYHYDDGVPHGGGDSHYTRVTSGVDRPESAGGGRFETTWGEEYFPDSGDRQQSVSVRQPDGSTYQAWRVTHSDGTWEERRVSKDAEGRGEVRLMSGDKSGTKSDETKPVEKKDDSEQKGGEQQGGEDDGEWDDHGGDDGAPVGDGDQGAGEGDPDARMEGVRLEDLVGADWQDREGLDTIGDLFSALAPYLDRMAAAARAGVGGHDEDVLDQLGAPPVAGFSLYGVEEDELKEYDSTGRPRPIFTGTVDAHALGAAGVEEVAGTAASVASMLAAAETVAHGAARLAGSIAVIRNS
jgi:hypothetical protein